MTGLVDGPATADILSYCMYSNMKETEVEKGEIQKVGINLVIVNSVDSCL